MTVFVFAIAVIAAVGIRATGERLLTRAHLERSASGASYAAAAKLADVYFEWQLARFDDEPRGRRPLSEVMSDRTTIALARDAADRVALANRVDRVSQFVVTCDTRGVIVTLGISGQQAQADFPTTECSLR